MVLEEFRLVLTGAECNVAAGNHHSRPYNYKTNKREETNADTYRKNCINELMCAIFVKVEENRKTKKPEKKKHKLP